MTTCLALVAILYEISRPWMMHHRLVVWVTPQHGSKFNHNSANWVSHPIFEKMNTFQREDKVASRYWLRVLEKMASGPQSLLFIEHIPSASALSGLLVLTLGSLEICFGEDSHDRQEGKGICAVEHDPILSQTSVATKAWETQKQWNRPVISLLYWKQSRSGLFIEPLEEYTFQPAPWFGP